MASLVAYWRMDETSGTTLKDSTGNGHDATLSGPYALSASAAPTLFANSSGVGSTGSTPQASFSVTGMQFINAPITISLWIRLGSIASQQYAIGWIGSSIRLGLKYDTTSTKFLVTKQAGPLVTCTTSPAAGTWYHVAYTWDGTTNTIYVNGSAEATSTTAHDAGSATSAAMFTLPTIGGVNIASGGILDDVRIYDAALTAAQVAGLAAGGPEDYCMIGAGP